MRTRLVLLAIVIAGALVSLARVPLPHLDTVWAEDGGLFLLEAAEDGPWNVLFQPYAGYQHLVPRIGIAAILTLVPLGGYGLAIFIACALLTGLVAAAVFWLSRDLVPWLPARLALAAITILLPLSAQEVLGNFADIHSYFMWLGPWLVLYRPRSLRGGIGWGIVAFLCAMTEIQLLLLLPLLLLNRRREHRNSWPIAAGLVLGGALQLVTTLLEPRDASAQWLGFNSVARGYLYNTVIPMLNPNPSWQEPVLQQTGVLVPLLVLVPFVTATVIALVKGTPRQRILVLTLVVGSIAVYTAGAVADASFGFQYGSHENGERFLGILNSRYGVASGMMLAAVVPVSASIVVGRLADRADRGAVVRRSLAWVAVIGLVAWFAVASTQSVSSRASGVTWSGSLAEARELCETVPSNAVVGVAIAPNRTADLTCAYLAVTP